MVGYNVKTDFSFNPFVGPNPIETGRKIFGRDREIDDLYYLLSAERIVMLHSPSGAGKTSLIQAGLFPRLNEQFDVWGRARVSKSPPNSPAKVNRYILSAVLDFEQQIPAERRRSEAQLADFLDEKTLADYFASRPRRRAAPQDVVLFFDQFEEILTADPLAIDSKKEFFKQVGELLLDPHVWALFAMREDYLPALDPYVEQVPTHLKNWFRLDLLRREDAAEAIINTAKEGGRNFIDEEFGKSAVVDAFVDDLATLNVQQPDGSFADQVGLYVEPLQLQVVCRQLWERMPARKQTIDRADIEKSGDVSQALGDYYASEVKKLAKGNDRIERQVREWVGEKLITLSGIRSQVLSEVGGSEGLDKELILSLVNTHLVRGEQHDSKTWYELAHDRLVAPIRDNNRDWFDVHLHKVQKLAVLWKKGGGDSLLPLGADLIEAQQWAIQNEVPDESIEGKFLKASAAKQERIDKEKRQVRRLRVMFVVVIIVALLAVVAAGAAMSAYRRAEEEKATANRLKVFAENQKIEADLAKQDAIRQKTIAEENLQKAKEQTFIAQEAENRAEENLQKAKEQTFIAQRQTLAANEAKVIAQEAENRAIESQQRTKQALDETAKARGFAEEKWAEASSRELAAHSTSLLQTNSDLSLILASKAMDFSHTEQAIDALWQALLGSGYLSFLKGKPVGVSVEEYKFSPDGKLIVTDDFISPTYEHIWRIWDAETGNQLSAFGGAGERLSRVVFSPDGRLLFTSSIEGPARIWEIATRKNLCVLEDTVKNFGEVVFSPDNRLVAIQEWSIPGLSRDLNRVRVWEIATGKQLFVFGGMGERVRFLSFGPNGKLIFIDSWKSSQFDNWGVWELDITSVRQRLITGGSSGRVVFSPDGKLFLSIETDRQARVWDVTTGKQLFVPEIAGEKVEDGTFLPNGKLIAISHPLSGASVKNTRIWDVATSKHLFAIEGASQAYFGPDPKLIFTKKGNGSEQVWDATTGKELFVPTGVGDKGRQHIIFSPNGKLVAISNVIVSFSPNPFVSIGPIYVWDVATGAQLSLLGRAGEKFSNVRFSPDGKLLHTSSQDGPDRIWETATGKPLLDLKGNIVKTGYTTFSDDSSLAVTVSPDDLAWVWDATTGKLLFTLGNPRNRISDADFSPDSRLVITHSKDSREFHFYDVGVLLELASSIEQMKMVARQVLPRELTPEERERYLHEPRSKRQ